jgi:hypothetical protein
MGNNSKTLRSFRSAALRAARQRTCEINHIQPLLSVDHIAIVAAGEKAYGKIKARIDFSSSWADGQRVASLMILAEALLSKWTSNHNRTCPVSATLRKPQLADSAPFPMCRRSCG